MPIQNTELIQQSNTPVRLSVVQIGQTEFIIDILIILVGLSIFWGTLIVKINRISNTFNNEIKPDIRELRKELNNLENQIDILELNEKIYKKPRFI